MNIKIRLLLILSRLFTLGAGIYMGKNEFGGISEAFILVTLLFAGIIITDFAFCLESECPKCGSEPKCDFATGEHQHCSKCDVVRKTPQEESWEFEYSKKFGFGIWDKRNGETIYSSDIVEFIRDLLYQSRAKTLAEAVESHKAFVVEKTVEVDEAFERGKKQGVVEVGRYVKSLQAKGFEPHTIISHLTNEFILADLEKTIK